MTQTTRKRREARLPDPATYCFFYGLLAGSCRKRNIHIDNGAISQLKPPFVAVCNHPSFFDWLYAAMALQPHRPSIIISRYYCFHPLLGPLLRRLGTIPKDLFSPDVQTVRESLQVVRMGGSICFFPEGRLSPDGAMETVAPATGRFLKRLGVPVVNIHIEGGYLTTPKYNHKPRCGRIDVTARPLFSAGELAALSVEEIDARLVQALAYDEFAVQAEKRIVFESRGRAERLEYLLYQCPRCGAEFTGVSHGSFFSCKACGNRVELDARYDFHPLDGGVSPPTIRDWYQLQRQTESRRVCEDEQLCLREKVILKMPRGGLHWFKPVGRGEAVLDRTGLRYSGTRDGKPYELFVALDTLPALTFGVNENFELYRGGEFFYFLPEHPARSVKWSVVHEQLYRRYVLEGSEIHG